ncbi:SDR family oxidoreductase [Pseudonocardia endophytica]|uniref:Enoyl-ACP reductase-like protein n=1 Tax=Pseudonocardia endophytica TaxID=401976 RepID=A0A4R1HWF3_PSEEN|nr:SDR family oxidoreductase [Pseudonocardia endophytica]TCK24329.1 enoyl-ACP reductase-like protein [Pseudonocardia endophytica]
MSADLFRLDGRSVLVTGGGSGIGQRLAAGLAEYGADVSVVDLPAQDEGSATTVARVRELGRRAVSIPADVTDPDSVAMIAGEEWKPKVEGFRDQTPMGRLGTPDDLVGPTIFLASDASAYLTGMDLLAEGGFTSW